MHDAAHYRLLDHRGLNDSRRPVALREADREPPLHLPDGASPASPLPPHRAATRTSSLSAPFPCGRRSFIRKLLRDAVGVSALVMRGYVTVDKDVGAHALHAARRATSSATGARRRSRPRALAAAIVGGLVHARLRLGVPRRSGAAAPRRLPGDPGARGVLEHAGRPGQDRIRCGTRARSCRRIPSAQFFLNPHHVGYHLEHHLYPGVPHYHLPRPHAALAATAAFDGALVERRYIGLVRRPSPVRRDSRSASRNTHKEPVR